MIQEVGIEIKTGQRRRKKVVNWRDGHKNITRGENILERVAQYRSEVGTEY